MPLIAPLGGPAKPVTAAPGPVNTPTPPKPVTATKGLGAVPGQVGAVKAGGKQAPLDASALANIASYLNKTGQAISNDQLGINNTQTQLQNALATDRQSNQLADLKLMTGANDSGGLYGSAYGQQLGNLNQTYGSKELQATSQANYNIGRLTNAIASAQASEPIYESGQAAASTSRAAALAAKMAPAGTTRPRTAPGRPPRRTQPTGTPFGGFRP